MTYMGGEYSTESLLKELTQQVQKENVTTFEAYKDLVDSLIEEKKSFGFFVESEDLEQLKHNLESFWPRIA